MPSVHTYEVRPRNDKRGVDLISDVLPFGRLVYGGTSAERDVAQRVPKSMACAAFLSVMLGPARLHRE